MRIFNIKFGPLILSTVTYNFKNMLKIFFLVFDTLPPQLNCTFPIMVTKITEYTISGTVSYTCPNRSSKPDKIKT